MKYFLKNDHAHIDCGADMPVYDEEHGCWRAGTMTVTVAHEGELTVEVVEDASDAQVLPLLTPMTLYMAFKPAERIAIKTSVDPLVQEFWAMYQLSVQLQKPTDPNLASVREAIEYLAAPVEPGPGAGILAGAERIGEILAGIPQ
ncbi:hypothetical protein [Duganella callida]|uniref:Uncharacterized protein n=1 Tax=Duganella callida TaxID=2561932 RepID=A0A4Y9S8L2_9BURK|nr:hypothetical protein [Duganella callida]TFW17976.1 hypothetical protein E4L98_19215 [Duganella callida]